MKNLMSILVVSSLCFYSVRADTGELQHAEQTSVEWNDLASDLSRFLAYADGPVSRLLLQPGVPQAPVPPVFHASQKTKGILIVSIGGGLLVGGIALAANSGHDVKFQEGYLSRRNKGELYGGLALGIAGAALLWYGLSRMK